MGITDVLALLGGLALFLYGMQMMSNGLETAAGNKMKSILEKLTSNRIKGVVVGAVITAVIQSSSATTVMVVGFVNSGLMTLNQAVWVIMGANIGTTITGQLIALDIGAIAPLIAFGGVAAITFVKNERVRHISEIFAGLGVLFIGMGMMGDAMQPLQQSETFVNFMTKASNPVVGILVGAIFTAVIQSSSASVGILQALAGTGVIPLSSAVYVLFGQNIGTCITAVLASIGTKTNAKRATVIHLMFNIFGSILFTFISMLTPFVSWVEALSPGNTVAQIANVHTIFNIGTTVLLFPVSNWIITLAKKLGRVEECTQEDDVVLLDDRMLQTPGIALQSTVTEIVRMGNIVAETLKESKEVLFTKSEETIKSIKEKESVVDKLSAGITDYAIKITALQVSEKEHQDVAHLLQVVSDMERICDYCENISECAEAMRERKLEFSEIATEEIKQMMDVCVESYLYAKEAFFEKSSEKAVKVIEKETLADDLEVRLRNKQDRKSTRLNSSHRI